MPLGFEKLIFPAIEKTDFVILSGGLPLIMYAPRGRGGQVSYTFLLRTTCEKRGGGPEVM